MSAMPLCFCFLAELVVDKAMELRFVGGVYGGNIKPTPFLCLTLKMLQIQPEKDIIVEFIKNEDFKWVKYLLANINILISWSRIWLWLKEVKQCIPFPKSHSGILFLRPLSFCFVCFDCINLLCFLNLGDFSSKKVFHKTHWHILSRS